MEKNDWKEIRPATAGLFARGVYPLDKAFYMSVRFDLEETVDPDVVRSAWEKTLRVYPYLGYAAMIRDNRLVFTENPLPFVIRETSEVVEPSGENGNFHTFTFCYLGKTLWVYVDHIPFDGTGVKFVMESFFYHYYCAYDNCDYPVPEGVHIWKDGAVCGQEEDAYLLADAVNPDVLSSQQGGETFLLPENAADGMFVPEENCRSYYIRVPHDELMSYAKSVKGSPFSVLTVFLAKVVERVHPENELPVKIMSPVSIRRVMGNTDSLLHQVVHEMYAFPPGDLAGKDDETLNLEFRTFLKGFTSEQNIRMLCGVYRGICEGYAQALQYGMLEKVIMDRRGSLEPPIAVNYFGIMRTGEYGSRIRMTEYSIRKEKGIDLLAAEIGGVFQISWYQGFHGDQYVNALVDLMHSAGMKSVRAERVR